MKNKVLKIIVMIVFIASINLLNYTYAENETKNTTNEVTNTTNETSSNTTEQTNETSAETTNQNTSSTSTNNNNNSSSNNGSSSSSSSQRQTQTSKKSSNANLSNLGIRPNDFTGFTPSKTTYDVEVPADVEKVEVYAQAQDSDATIKGTGEVELKEGVNTITVQVTAEDGTTKTYTLNITRGENQTQTDDTTASTENGLSKLEISNAKLEPEFKTDVYEYKVKYIGEATSLEITTETTQQGYSVEILGNENLKEGENLISIVVTDAEGNNVATYQLIVNKSLVDEEALEREKAEKEARTKTIIISVAVAVLVIIAIVAIIIRRRKNRAYAEDYLEPYSGMDDNDDFYNTNNMDYDNYNNYDDYDNNNQNSNYDDYNNDFNSNKLDNNYNEENYKNSNTIQENNNTDLIEDIKEPADEEQKLKEKMRKEFLDNYNLSDFEDEYEETPRKKHKGKRFK